MAQENNYTLANINAAMGIQGSGTPEEQRLAQGLRDQQRTADFLTGSTITPQQNVGKQMNNRINTGAEQYGRISQDREGIVSRESEGALDRTSREMMGREEMKLTASEGFKGREHDVLTAANNAVYRRAEQDVTNAQELLVQGNEQGFKNSFVRLTNSLEKERLRLLQEFKATNNETLHQQALALEVRVAGLKEGAATRLRDWKEVQNDIDRDIEEDRYDDGSVGRELRKVLQKQNLRKNRAASGGENLFFDTTEDDLIDESIFF